MADEVAIKVDNVSKTFKLPHEKNTSLKSAAVSFYRRKQTFEAQQVLKDVTFEIKKGEFFGIVGRNGSGKSTLLKLLAGIYTPTEGSIHINGKLTPFIELGVGFNPELTGRENVFLNGALLGFNRTEMQSMYKDIVSFAEMKRFMDQKLKNYSSGMQVRLAFSIAIRAKSDILLIDEVLAVGDAAFQSKCYDYFSELKKTGTTVIFVSHDRASLERFCKDAILINNGEIKAKGSIRDVLKKYSEVVLGEVAQDKADESNDKSELQKDSPAKITKTFTSSENTIKNQFVYGEQIQLNFLVKAQKNIKNPVLGITVWQKNTDKAVYATNTLMQGVSETGNFKVGDEIHFKVEFPEGLNDGEYFIEPAIANEAGTVFYDQVNKAATFYIAGSSNPYSLLSSPQLIEIKTKKGVRH
jgi:ABC-2 type transport system ATP-binding protein